MFSDKELRALCVKPRSQNSFRPLRWDAVRAAAMDKAGVEIFGPLDATTRQMRDGHTTRPTRVRLGQREFRQNLLTKYNACCAFTGDLPEVVLDACHLYSYAKVGRHHEHGGILLRRDLHTLFDRGIIAVTEDATVDVAPAYRQFPVYQELHGRQLAIDLSSEQRQWLELHWGEHRQV
ncbi:HNH endonuclease [Rhodococcus jostii]|uniref:HNH endonuclease n=1 Tax=Rhodococcus jostii TaxID=132919 RepID=UPI003629D1F9